LPGVDERVRRTVEWLAEAVDPGDALVRVRRKKARRRIVRRAGATALVVVVLAATAGGVLALARIFGLGAKPRPAAVLGDRSVAFVSDQDGDNEIYAIKGNGRPTRLTDNDADDRAPAWSPDGTRVAFLRREGQAFFVYLMSSDGTEARRVTQPVPGDVVAGEVSGETMWFSRLSWFPDGSRIAFGGREVGLPCPAEGCPYQDLDIFSVGIDGSDLVNLTDTNATDEWDPAWAPDDDTIVFVRTLRQEGEPPPPGRIPQLYIMDPDAPGVGRLTDLPGSAVNPAWSPDGTRIAFEGDGDIYVMNADATGLRRLAVLPPPDAGNAAPHPSYGNYEPSWSSDGTKVVFASDRDGDRDLYVMPADGTEDQAVRVTDLKGDESQPAVQGQRLTTPLDTPRWETYRDRQLGWSMAYPSEWRLQTFHEEFIGPTFRGALVSNVDFEFRHPDLGEGAHTGAWDMRGLPPDAVVVEFHALARFGLPTEPPDTKLPLSLDDARPVRDRPPYGAPQPRLFLSLGETGYAMFAWFGPNASERDREIARRIVATITFDATPPSSESIEPFAIWPEDTPEEARAAGSGRYNEPEMLVADFAKDVLGWDEARVSVAEPGHGGATAYAVERGDGPVALVLADQRVEGVWSVVGVSALEPDLGVDPPMSVDIREDTATIYVRRFEAKRVEFRMGYGTEEERRAEAGPGVSEVSIDLSGVDRTRPGHLLILFRAADGRVFLAQGVPLPSGDYAEG
jgi:Tol biopolymer transport system component